MSNNTAASIELTFAETQKDIEEILSLQQLNLKINVSEEVKKDQGFLTVCHSEEQLQIMQSLTPQIIAKADGKVIAFALAMLPSMGKLIPDLQPMFDIVDDIEWKGKMIRDYKYYMMGQICVAAEFRGQGIFDKLYLTHKKFYEKKFDLCITEISTSNKRSQRAHERVGFETIHLHEDHVDEWNVVAWELKHYVIP
ncbi:GNAT family N-acetyltransferase [Dyadobacter subterraneus]|uniref:GNAT family N-acetyltransferase n=1 Tax=Dyadobacter subterraneus TaxID=2773304 RepID=A0ABR9WN63_9BACT|nr:GNAT family N-acetyltransferase [Dyadobacter subterraneus]MBE9466539.1 GNAT family N-acetyltransferase [Dyadobacter subterraneus]